MSQNQKYALINVLKYLQQKNKNHYQKVKNVQDQYILFMFNKKKHPNTPKQTLNKLVRFFTKG